MNDDKDLGKLLTAKIQAWVSSLTVEQAAGLILPLVGFVALFAYLYRHIVRLEAKYEAELAAEAAEAKEK